MAEPIGVNIYGDSLMKGTVTDETFHYKTTMAERIKKLEGLYNLSIKNRSRIGSTSDRGLVALLADLQHGLSCQYAVIAFGGNDCSFLWDEVAANPEGEHLPLVELGDFSANCLKMCTLLKDAGVSPVLVTPPPINPVRYLKYIGKGEQGQQAILRWLGTVDLIYRWHEMYSNEIVQLAHQTGNILIDIRRSFLDKRNLEHLIGPDGIHLTAAGYDLMFDAFCRFLDSRLDNGQEMTGS